MYRKNTNSWLKHWDFILLDLLCMEVAFWAAVLIRNGAESEQFHFPVYTHASVALLFLNICVVFFSQSYHNVLKRDWWEEFGATLMHVTLIVAAMLVYIYMMQETYDYSRIVYVLFWALYLFFSSFGRYALKRLLLSMRKANKGNRSLIVIAWSRNAEDVVRRVHDKSVGDIKITGVALMDAYRNDEISTEIAGFPIIATGSTVLSYLKEQWVDEVFICPPPDTKAPQDLIDACREMGITQHLKIADTTEPGMSRSVEKMGGYTVLTESIRMATPSQALQKKIMDILGGLIGIVLTGIAFIFVAPAIWIKSPGPIFFSQMRVGKNGKLFKIYKFRSMYMDAEERKKDLMAQNQVKDGMMFKIEDDPRIIKGIGHFIRRTSIDELPQFWNVLKGDMSLVGTRPPTVDEWEKYELHHRRRLAVKPGITGMWQVSGRSNINDFEQVVRLDTQYIQEWSIWLDVKILLKTVKVIVKREGSA